MKVSRAERIAKHIKEFYFGGNWTAVNLSDTLKDVRWEEAVHKRNGFHSIAELLYHINYFVKVVIRVLEGHPLEGNDAVSFDCPPIKDDRDWETLKDRTRAEAKYFIALVEKIPEKKMDTLLGDPKYGTFERNLLGILEHSHYHLGQIVLLKKLSGESK
jgi:uncharacterized damage-inducible protein DinB